MKITAFETENVLFELSQYGWLFLKPCLLLKSNLDCHIFSVVCSWAFVILALFFVTSINILCFVYLNFSLCLLTGFKLTKVQSQIHWIAEVERDVQQSLFQVPCSKHSQL